jgi:hypothetical protein
MTRPPPVYRKFIEIGLYLEYCQTPKQVHEDGTSLPLITKYYRHEKNFIYYINPFYIPNLV